MSQPLYDMATGVPGVRLATKADEAEIFSLLMLMHNEMAFFSVDRAKVIDCIRVATERRGGIIYVIENNESRVVASVGLFLGSDWYTNDESFLERWNYVHPDYRRGTDHARRLIDQLKWTNKRFQKLGRAVPIQIGINATDRTEAKIRLYARNFACIGAYFLVGDAPRKAMNEHLHAELAKIDEMNRERSHRKRPNVPERPAVAEVIRASRSAWG